MSNINLLVLEQFNPANDLYLQKLAKDNRLKIQQRHNFIKKIVHDQPGKFHPDVIRKVLGNYAKQDGDRLSRSVETTRSIFN